MFEFIKANQVALNSVFVCLSLILTVINSCRTIKTKRRKLKELHEPIINAIPVLETLRKNDPQEKWDEVFQKYVNGLLVKLSDLEIECPEDPPVTLVPNGITSTAQVSRLIFFLRDLIDPVSQGQLSWARVVEVELDDARIQLREQNVHI